VSQQVRFAPSSLDVVYWRNGHIVVNHASGGETVVNAGHHPAWFDGRRVAYCPPQETAHVVVSDVISGAAANTAVPAGNTLTARAGKVAVHRIPAEVFTSWGRTIPGSTDPVLSADGRWLAMIDPDLPAEGMSRVSLLAVESHVFRVLYSGHALRPRFSHTGTSLCWEEAGGAIYGIRDVANHTSPVVRLSRPGDQCYHPVPIWCPERSELLLCYVQAVSDTEADVIVAGWESCVAQQPSGYVVARSGGSGFDLDAKEAA
jgi:hypothetical protein